MEKINFHPAPAPIAKERWQLQKHLKNLLANNLSNPALNTDNQKSAAEPARPHLLKDINLKIERSTITHIVGPSGSGKSTLIRMLNRMNEPTSGELEILGKSIFDWQVRQLRREVAFVFQRPSLVGLDVRENLLLPFKLQRALPENIDERMGEALKLCGLDDTFLTRRENQLSGGQKQRVALARALITNPQILLLDEPTSSLDPPAATALLDRVAKTCKQRHITLLIVTHRIGEVKQLGGNLAVLIDGRLRGFGAAEQLLNGGGDKQVNNFLQGKTDESD